MLSEHRAALDALATALMARETLDGDEITRIVEGVEGAVVGPFPAVGA